jgi:NADH-quinone oxidoreductase subunit B
MQGLVLLGEAVGKERRPLSWVIGEQGVIKPQLTSMKDRKREERMGMVDFRPIDEI